MNFKKVVVCVAVYNSESTIKNTLESLVNQTYPIFKIKIFDNASTDSTRLICSEFAEKHPHIEIFSHPENIGAEGNFSACLQAASGDYTLIAHADDIYAADFIKVSVNNLERNPNAVASFTKAIEIDSAGKKTGERLFPKEISRGPLTVIDLKDFFRLVSLYGNFITCPSVVCRSNIYREQIKTWNGGDFKTSADLDVWFRLLNFGSIIAVNTPLIYYRVAEASYSFRIAKKRITKHDFFKVTDFYQIENPNLIDLEIKENFVFLELKDQALRMLNLIRTKNPENEFPFDIKLQISLVLKKMFHSCWHLKMGVSILGIYTLAILKKSQSKVLK